MSDRTAAFLVIATGKYDRYIGPLWASIEKHFLLLPGWHRELFLFTDKPETAPPNAVVTKIEHERWPGPTLHRYRTFLTRKDDLAKRDYLFYLDADMLVVDEVNDEVLSDTTMATIHPGFNGQSNDHFTYERHQGSNAYIAAGCGKHYYCGGFQGGTAKAYIEAMEWMAHAIADDESRGVMAAWQDESHWNRWCLDHPPGKIMSPQYCTPEGWNTPGQKILALNKNHSEMRSP